MAADDTMDPISSSCSGVYDVKESGLEFRHIPNPETNESSQKSGPEFVQDFRNNFSMRVLEQSEHELVFEAVGMDVSLANALRRILLSEVPTVAIEHVYMWNNSSILHDEVLAHRLGLIPINVDARLFDKMEQNEDATDRNTIVFRLAVACSKQEGNANNNNTDKSTTATTAELLDDSVSGNTQLDQAAAAATAPQDAMETPGRPYTKHVYSRDLEWVPQGDQESRFPNGIHPVHDDILLAKLRPGQSIELEAHGRVGIGKDHAKYSPVATASYRLLPQIQLIKPVYDELAQELVHLYEPGVFELVPAAADEDPPHTQQKARVCNPYACTMSRNYMRNPQLAESIRMSRIPNHFVFSVESVGMTSPAVLVAEALRVLQTKCQHVQDMADQAQHDTV